MDKYVKANAIISLFCNSYSELKKNLPIRPSEMGVLNIIVQKEGKFTPLMLSQLLEVSKPMVTAYIVSLEKKGYITRDTLSDKRSFYVIPTNMAKELVETTLLRMNKYLKEIEDAIGEENFASFLSNVEMIHNKIKVMGK